MITGEAVIAFQDVDLRFSQPQLIHKKMTDHLSVSPMTQIRQDLLKWRQLRGQDIIDMQRRILSSEEEHTIKCWNEKSTIPQGIKRMKCDQLGIADAESM